MMIYMCTHVCNCFTHDLLFVAISNYLCCRDIVGAVKVGCRKLRDLKEFLLVSKVDKAADKITTGLYINYLLSFSFPSSSSSSSILPSWSSFFSSSTVINIININLINSINFILFYQHNLQVETNLCWCSIGFTKIVAPKTNSFSTHFSPLILLHFLLHLLLPVLLSFCMALVMNDGFKISGIGEYNYYVNYQVLEL